MAVIFRWQGNGLDAGPLTTSSAGTGDTAPSLVNVNDATATIVTTSARSPAIRLHEEATGSQCWVDWTLATSTTATLRLYFTATDALATTHAIFSLRTDTKIRVADVILTSTGSVRVYDVDNAFQTIGGAGTIEVGTQYRFEMTVDTQTGILSMAVFNGHSTTPIASQNNVVGNFIEDNIGCLRLGKNATTPQAETQLWDDIVLTSDTTFVGPAIIIATVSAGADQESIEPFSTVSLAASELTGTITSWSWTQTSGTAVTLTGSGATRTFIAPASTATQTLGFQVTGDGTATDAVSITINPHLEWMKTSTGLSPLRSSDSL